MTALQPSPRSTIVQCASPPASGRKIGVAWLAISAIAIGLAIQVFYGQYNPLAIKWLSVAMFAAGVALVGGKVGSRRMVVSVLAIGLAVEFFRLGSETLFPQGPASLTLRAFTPAEQTAAVVCLAIAAGCAIGLIWPRVRVWALAGLLAMHFALGVLLIYSFPHPGIDVYVFERGAATAFVHGHDPYAVRFHDMYGHDSAMKYGAGSSANGWLRYGYPYPPVPMLVGAAGLIFGDVRYGYLAAVSLAGILMVTARRPILPMRGGVALDLVGGLAAAMVLLLPSQFLVIQCGFSEPAVVLLLAATVWTSLRHPRWLAIPLGLLLVCKQYMIFAVPAVWLLLPVIPRGKRLRIALETIAVGAAAGLPFAAVAGKRFFQSVVVWQFHQPFRTDALSYPALFAITFPHWASSHHIELLAPLAGFAAATGVLVICLWRVPRTPAGFAAAIGLTMLAFFAFNKQAFCNYYYFVIAAFCTAIAATNAVEPPRRREMQKTKLPQMKNQMNAGKTN